MNTRVAELRIQLAELVRASVQQGIVPDFITLAGEADVPDAGEVRSSRVTGGIAKSSEINTAFENIEHNMDVFDIAAVQQANNTIAHRESFASKLLRLERGYQQLAFRAQSLLLASRTGSRGLYVLSDTFNDLSKVDLADTTAIVNTEQGTVEIPFDIVSDAAETGENDVTITEVKLFEGVMLNTTPPLTSSIDDLTATELYGRTIHENETVLTELFRGNLVPFLNVRSGGISLGNTFSNNFTHTWESNSQQGVEYEVTMRLQTDTLFKGSNIEFEIAYPDTTEILWILGSSDGLNYERINYFRNGKFIYIPVSNMYQDKEILFRFYKRTHDGEYVTREGIVKHQFVFSINNLRMPHKRYKEEAYLTTGDWTLPEALSSRGISKYKVEVDAISPGDTSVSTYVSWGNSTPQLIIPGVEYALGLSRIEQSFHTSGRAIREFPTPIYLVSGESESGVYEHSMLYEGYEQFEVESTTYNITRASLSAWSTISGDKKYSNIKFGSIYLAPEKSHKLFGRIDCDTPMDLLWTNVGVKSAADSSFAIQDYLKIMVNDHILNGKRLPNGTMEFRLSLVKGTNYINILVGIQAEGSGGNLEIGQVFITPGLRPYVKRRTCTSYAALLSLDQYESAYAVWENKIYLNYMPPPGAAFLHEYRLPTTGLPNTCALRFELNGNQEQSPKLLSYILELTPGSPA